MSDIPFISARDVEDGLSWTQIADALAKGHRGNRASLGDLLLREDGNSILNRAAWIDGQGIALKSVTVFPKNVKRQPPVPSVQGVVILFDPENGAVRALVDGALVTKWKTAGDSVLGARLLARKDSRSLLIIGSGAVAATLIDAYGEIFPGLERIDIWSRTFENAEKLASSGSKSGILVNAVTDLPTAVNRADIISTATMAIDPVLQGEWVRPGTHVDLIGAFTPDMREGDDDLLQRSEIFVDSRDTTIGHIGELMIPLQSGAISENDIRGDLYDLCQGSPGRGNDEAITLFKNGGGAHLDLMTALAMLDLYQQNQQ